MMCVEPEDSAKKLQSDLCSFHSLAKYPNVTLCVQNKKFPVYKAILATRTDYFAKLFYSDPENDEREIHLDLAQSAGAFAKVLEYIYTGKICKISLCETLEVFAIASKFSMTDLQDAILEKLKNHIQLSNVCQVLNLAMQCNVNNLQEACFAFIETDPLAFLRVEDFANLSAESVIFVISKDHFFAPEIEIFRAVAQWCQHKQNIDCVLNCIRLSLISSKDLKSTVLQSKLFDSARVLRAVSQSNSSNETVRARLIPGKNVVCLAQGAKIVSSKARGANKDPQEFLLRKNKNMIIKLAAPTIINYITISIMGKFAAYIIELSLDCKSWKRIVKVDRCYWPGKQVFQFENEPVLYIKVKGTDSEVTKITWFTAKYAKVDRFPETVNGIRCPQSINIAVKEWGTASYKHLDGFRPISLITRDGNEKFTAKSSFHRILPEHEEYFFIRFSKFGKSSV